ncbi:MAG: glycosyltransferase family 4 protein [Gemmatimonadetes bacterium]|nr:glycosyltransferase family 4 protein [Gemmatimonadota bacterium]
MRTIATLVAPGSFVDGDAGALLVGRVVANTGFIQALRRFCSFDAMTFFVGDAREGERLTHIIGQIGIDPAWVRVRNVLELPAALAGGEISVLHQLSHAEAFPHLVWLRDRHAAATTPVTAQVHALSYPRLVRNYIALLLHPPAEHDAIFCSSRAGRRVVEASFAAARAACSRSFGRVPGLACELPLVPLGVDVGTLGQGDRAGMRCRLGLPPDALVVLVLARFSEHDKMDLLPVLQAFRDVVVRPTQPERPLHLALAGARQGTDSPEMVLRWASQLGIGDRVVLRVDFPGSEHPDILAAADIFLSPADSVQETFGLSVAEAMAAGLPVIASDFDGYKDTVTVETGIRVPTRWGADPDLLSDLGPVLYERPLHLMLGQSIEVDLDAMSAAIHALAMDDARRGALGRAARARARSCYDWSVVLPQYEAVWNRLAARPRRRRPADHEPSPLGMSFGTLFAHHPGAGPDPHRIVRRLPFADHLMDAGAHYPVYPDLESVFGEDDVAAALAIAAEPVPADALAAALQGRWPPCDAWRAQLLVAWLLKHGLVG